VVTPVQWVGSEPEFGQRVFVVAPHPDDEVLGCAGIMCWLDAAGTNVEIIAVTDGNASHARSTCITGSELVVRRDAERRAALEELGVAHLRIERLGFPDSRVAGRERDLVRSLTSRIDRESTVIVPWRHDGHPDHEAVARAGLAAARTTGARCLEVPIWTRVRGRRYSATHVLDLGSTAARKRSAAAHFQSQNEALGPDPLDGPVVHPNELEMLTSSTEVIIGPR